MTALALPLTPHEVSRVSFDYAVTLVTDHGGEIRIETPFTVSAPERAGVLVDPASVGNIAADLVAMLHLRIESAEATGAGVLSLRLSSGAVVVVEPHEHYEAWTYADRSGSKAVCAPGGGVTTWGFGTPTA